MKTELSCPLFGGRLVASKTTASAQNRRGARLGERAGKLHGEVSLLFHLLPLLPNAASPDGLDAPSPSGPLPHEKASNPCQILALQSQGSFRAESSGFPPSYETRFQVWPCLVRAAVFAAAFADPPRLHQAGDCGDFVVPHGQPNSGKHSRFGDPTSHTHASGLDDRFSM